MRFILEGNSSRLYATYHKLLLIGSIKNFTTQNDQNSNDESEKSLAKKSVVSSVPVVFDQDDSEGVTNSNLPSSMISENDDPHDQNVQDQPIISSASVPPIPEAASPEQAAYSSQSSSSSSSTSGEGDGESEDNSGQSPVSVESLEPQYLTDSIMGINALTVLSVFTESASVKEESDIVFDKYVEIQNVYTIPSSELTHFKNSSNAKELLESSNILFINFKNWAELYNRYVSSIIYFSERLLPISPVYLREIEKSVYRSDSFQESPSFFLAGCGSIVTGSFIYGLSHGAQDLLYFGKSYYSSVSITYNYSSVLASEVSGDRKEFSLELSNGVAESKFNRKFKLLDKAFDVVGIDPKYTIPELRSIYSKTKYNKVLSELFTITSQDAEIKPNYTASSMRVGNVVKATSTYQYEDSFVIKVMANDDVRLHISDRTIFDMIISLLYINDNGITDTQLETICNYIGTTIYKYCLDQLFVKQGVKCRTLRFSVSVSRKSSTNDSKILHDIYTKNVDNSNLVLISPLHYMFYFSKIPQKLYDQWSLIIYWSSLVNVGLNDVLQPFLPSISKTDRVLTTQVLKNKEMFDSSYYQSEVCLPWQKTLKISISTNDFILQLFIRNLVMGDIPMYFPLMSRGQWKGTNGSSYTIGTSVCHRVQKFCLIDPSLVIKEVTERITMRHELTRPPSYVKRTTRLSDKIPNIFDRILPTINEHEE